jgi:hypothetical protein
MGDLHPLDIRPGWILASHGLRPLDPHLVLTEDQEVEVELPGPPASALMAAERPLEALERDEQREGAVLGGGSTGHLERDHRVVEVGLLGDAHRSRSIQARDADEARAREIGERACRARKRGGRIAQVGAEPDERTDTPHARPPERDGW